ncbi:HI0074 family nucleotidyltransferase substrate-binding subunit [bacterium]|nr:HI0074 family nucleotidyltransferase substrate-binding subunit [bacterium]
MEKLILKREKLLSTLDRIEESLLNIKNIEIITKSQDYFDKENLYRTFRDSLIQRFEFSSDLFWKYLKLFLADELNQNIEFNAPKGVIRQACKAKMLTEEDTSQILDMIKDRNMSSHIYKEEIADQIALEIAKYHAIMKKYTQKLVPTDI